MLFLNLLNHYPRKRKQALLPSNKLSRSNAQSNRSHRYSSQVIHEVYYTTEERHDKDLGWQLAWHSVNELRSLAADKADDLAAITR